MGAILKVAEEQNIYKMPVLPNSLVRISKFAPSALRFLDMIDPASSLTGLYNGSSLLFGRALQESDQELRVMITEASKPGKKKKVLTLKHRTVAEVLAQARHLLHLIRKPTAVLDRSGHPLSDEI